MLPSELRAIKENISRNRSITLDLPRVFAFKDHDIFDFESFLKFFDWTLSDRNVRIDLRNCLSANFQALSLLVLYGWRLSTQGCNVRFITENTKDHGVSAMWGQMGAPGLFWVLGNENQQFKGYQKKPLFAVRNIDDFKGVIQAAESYTKGFNVEYEGTLRYVLGELLYNTLEHGRAYTKKGRKQTQIPSIVQFTWYKTRNEIQFIIADIGIGVKRHIEQAYPGQESDEEAIKLAIKPKISGTFGRNDPYTNKNNAGMGLYISSNIIRRLNADMHVVSGNGLLHISPRDITGKTMQTNWPGTFVLVTVRLEDNPQFELHKIMQEFRDFAAKELKEGDKKEDDNRHYISISNYFGNYAEDKEAAIKFRDRRLFPEINAGKTIVIDFDRVVSSPHSFLSALLASPIKTLGMAAYKQLKFVNATPEIRETIDFIFDDNT
ncbi:hypothetical protein CNX70_00020 [Janthinobacterium svalbardensis]|uniref:DUF4325 domain-containing protein n=1 Tax=Janthinobacterium svalbardensis TaxID=368607 RepID=A0A290X329_9BURK|nr:DUF4325 domain-containing protein [Janthinobacterium svalbardensis]ATD63552.1 hypothetical protein CNX70_00020 [Janthinobacterium svalbardensis]